MLGRLRLSIVPLALLAVWLVYVAIGYAQSRLEHEEIASDLHMENRTFYTLPNAISSPCRVDGEERRLVVGVSDENYLVCSIVRNLLVSDARADWRVDVCFRPDLEPNSPRLPIWKPLKNFPTEADLKIFQTEALAQPWVCWDRLNGTDPIMDE